MTIDTDFHSHIVPSSAQQMVQRAQEKKLRVLGISEHIFQMEEGRPPLAHMPLEGPMLTLADYRERVREAALQAQLDVRTGLEVDFVPDRHETIAASIARYAWDFLIGSVHEIDRERIEVPRKKTREEGEMLWLRYFALLRGAVASRFFSVVSHPVRMRVANPHIPPTLDDELEQLAAEATLCIVALEINGYDVLTSTGLVRRLARACALQNTPVSVGSDAHNPRGVAQAHEQTESILKEAGITKLRIWKDMDIEEYEIN
jgi:histidinol-phosphatase (PHP family)